MQVVLIIMHYENELFQYFIKIIEGRLGVATVFPQEIIET